MSGVPVIKFLFKSEWKVLTDSLNINPVYESEEFDSANDLTTYLSGASAGLIVTSLRDKYDLIQLASFIKLAKRVAPNAVTKVFVVNFSGDKQFEKACSKLGILDLIDPKIQTKALRFKVDFVMKSINAQIKKSANNAAAANASVKSLEANKAAQEKKAVESAPVWADPLETEDDIWILKTESECKKVLTRWLVKLMGPSPYVAQWVDSGTPGVWKFDFKNGKQDFIYGEGTWFFRGDQKPDFVWSENLWLFTGTSFDLFYQEKKEVCSRVKLQDKSLIISKNSEYAKTKERKIIESFDKEIVFKKEQVSNGGTESIEKDAEKYKNLEGKGKTDNLEQGPLSGKGKTDSLDQGPLSGKGKTSNLSSDPLGMDLKPGENVSNTDPLSQKADQKKSSSFWKGKNEYEQEDKSGSADGPAGEAARKGAELGLESKNSLQKYYKNHNEAEQFEGKDLDLSGKSSTDEIEGHLTSPDARKEKQKGEKSDGEWGGKSATDKLPGHLTSPNARDEKDSKEKKNSEEKERSAKDLSGKSATDKLPGHLTSPNAIAEKETKDKKADKADLPEEVAALSKDTFMGGKPNSSDDSSDASDEEESLDELEDFKNALENPKKGQGRKSEGGTDKISSVYSSRKKDNNSEESDDSEDELETAGKSDKKAGKVLPFREKPLTAEPELKDVGSKDMLQAVKTAIVTSYIIKDSRKIRCNLDDHFEQTIIFSTKEAGVNTSESVTLNLNFNYLEKDTSLKFSADVVEVENDGEGSQYITVQISQENASAFNAFMKLYHTRQENITLFLKTAKGY